MPFPSSHLAQSGQYTDIHLIGQGGFGLIYAATQPLTQRVVAVKEVLPSSAHYAAAFTRFRSEIRLQARLSHPNIVQVYDAVEDPQTHELYLVSEYVPGGSLADNLAARGPLAQDEALRVALELCVALEQLAAAGIVHGDIKPSNILLVPDGLGRIAQAKLSDFGSAVDRHGPPPTIVPGQAGLHPITPAYMAPELATAANIQDVDVRADLYALGMVLWEMLTCTIYALLPMRQLRDLTRYVPQPLDGLAEVIAKATRPDPDDRYQSPQQLAQDLRDVLSGRWGAVPATTLLPRASAQPQPPVPATPRRWPRRWPRIAAGVMVIAGLLIPAGAFWRNTHQADVRPETTYSVPTAPSVVVIPAPSPTAATAPPGLAPLQPEAVVAAPKPSVPPTIHAAATAAPVAVTPSPTAPAAPAGSPDALGQFGQIAQWGNGAVRDIVYAPDGALVAVASSYGVYLYDPKTIEQVGFINGPGIVKHILFSPDSQILAVISDPQNQDDLQPGATAERVSLWSIDEGRPLQSFEGYAAVFLPDGQTIALALLEGIVKLRRISDGALLSTITLPGADLTFSPDGQTIAAVSLSKRLTVWQYNGDSFSFTQNVLDLPSNVRTLVVAPGGQALATESDDRTVRLWRAGDGNQLQNLSEQTRQYRTVAFSPDSQTLAIATPGGTVELLQVSDGALLRSLPGHAAGVERMAFSPDSQTIISASGDGSERLWRVSDGALLATLTNSAWITGKIAFSPDSQTFALASAAGPITFWRAGDGAPLASLDGFSAPISDIALAPDGATLASADANGNIKLWQVSDGALLRIFSSTLEGPARVAFSPDDQLLAAAAADGSTRLWQLDNAQLMRTLVPPADSRQADPPAYPDPSWENVNRQASAAGAFPYAAFAPDGQTLAVVGDSGTVALWRVADGTLLDTLTGYSAAFSPDGQLLALGTRDGSVQLLRRSDGALLHTLEAEIAQLLSAWPSRPTGRRWPAPMPAARCGSGSSARSRLALRS